MERQERRRHPRIQLLAEVKLSGLGVVHTMKTLDVSLSGLFVVGSPKDFPGLEVGTEVDFVLYPTPELAEHGAREVDARARVVRVEQGGLRRPGFGLEIQRIDSDNMHNLGGMIKKFTDLA